MSAELQSIKQDIEQSLELLRSIFDPDAAQKRLDELNAKSEDPALWDDPTTAQKLMRERNELEGALSSYKDLKTDFLETVELAELADGDADLIAEAVESLRVIRQDAQTQELQTLLSGEADRCDTYIDINAGAGGTESQDWASMLLRMYMRWASDHEMKCTLISESPGEEAGIKSATIEVKGSNAYGWLKTESGVHRLVRISPFDSNARRHTSFASVWVYPVIDDSIEIDVSEKDVRIDTYRASGAGGQHVNTTDSAVRITHEATGIVVQCQNERSQHKNRATAWNMLRARLYELEMQKRQEEAQQAAESKTEIGWGHQIRSYVLQPYQMVKDLRTNIESSNPSAVLDGDIDPFLTASLAMGVAGKPATEES